jgi:hypothetical protein
MEKPVKKLLHDKNELPYLLCDSTKYRKRIAVWQWISLANLEKKAEYLLQH